MSGIAALVYLKNLRLVARISAESMPVLPLNSSLPIKYTSKTIRDPKKNDGNLAAHQFIPKALNEAPTSQ